MSNAPDSRRRVLTASIVRSGILDALRKLDPRLQVRNPVMFVVYAGSLLTTVLGVLALTGAVQDVGRPAFVLSIAGWLWLTVLFANFAEAVAEGRGKAQAAALRSTRREVNAKRLSGGRRPERHETVPANSLRKGEFFLVEAREIIPADGEVVEGVASVDESAVTGESAPVLREAGSDFSSVTGGTRVLSDWLVVRVTSDPGESFLDRMIAMVEGARRGKTPNEIALSILLAMLTLVFLLATATLAPFSAYAVASSGGGEVVSIVVLVALLVCLIPTTIGGLLSRSASPAWTAWCAPTSSPPRAAPSRLRATSTCCCSTRPARSRSATGRRRPSTQPPGSASESSPTWHSSPRSPTRRRRAARSSCWRSSDSSCAPRPRRAAACLPQVLGPEPQQRRRPRRPPASQGRGGRDQSLRRGRTRRVPRSGDDHRARRGAPGATPLVVADGARVLGVVELRDIVKGGIRSASPSCGRWASRR